MKYTNFKGMKISQLGMGNMRLPVGEDGKIDREKAREIIEYAYNNGITYYDTAFRYHGGESELFIGEVMKQFPRESFYLASKMPGHMMFYKDGTLGFQGYLSDFHVDHISEIFEEQLQKCQTEYFDFYLLHNMAEASYDFYTNDELGVVRYLLEQKEAGRIRHLGFSSHGSAETIDRFLTHFEGVFEFVQIQLNYLDWEIQDAKSKYDVITKHGLPVIVMEPVRGGRLVDMPEEALTVLEGADRKMTPAAWALQFCADLPNDMVVLSGMSTLEQIKENVELFNKEEALSDKDRETLNQVIHVLADLVPCTGCRYCTEECPMGLEIPDLITLYNQLKNGSKDAIVKVVAEMDEAKRPHACIGCGACQRMCPQTIAIPEIMQDFVKLLEE